MTDVPKPPPHPARTAKHPGRGKVQPHQRNTFQQEQHAKAMKRRSEPLMIARHSLKPHTAKPKGHAGDHDHHPKGHKS